MLFDSEVLQITFLSLQVSVIATGVSLLIGLPLLAALMAGFGSVISEVGASMMVGGNIREQTRVPTTAIVLETSKGEFGVALALSTLLLILTYLINLALTWIQQKGARR